MEYQRIGSFGDVVGVVVRLSCSVWFFAVMWGGQVVCGGWKVMLVVLVGEAFGTLLGPEITGLLVVVVPWFVRGVVMGGGFPVVSGFPAHAASVPCVGWVWVCRGCWLRTA